MTITSASVHDEGEYTCVLGDHETTAELSVIGQFPGNGQFANLSLIAAMRVALHASTMLMYSYLVMNFKPLELPPDFVTPLGDVSIARGQQTMFQVTLSKGDATAKWFKDKKEIVHSDRIQNIIDGKVQKLVIQHTADGDAGMYTCKLGDKRCSAELIVHGKMKHCRKTRDVMAIS